MAKVIYEKVTNDELELPIAVADSISELARMLGVTPQTICTQIRNEKLGLRKSNYRKVIIDDD